MMTLHDTWLFELDPGIERWQPPTMRLSGMQCLWKYSRLSAAACNSQESRTAFILDICIFRCCMYIIRMEHAVLAYVTCDCAFLFLYYITPRTQGLKTEV